MKYSACIQFLSSRRKCLKKSLESLFRHYNQKYQYPVYVHYFDDIYDDQEYRVRIWDTISHNIIFLPVPYSIPDHIPEEELYYNRQDLWYVRKHFPRTRSGYLHMCNFICHMYDCPITLLDRYEYIIVHDDESGYLRDLPFDPVEKIEQLPVDMGAYITGPRLKDGKPHQGHLDSRIGLWEFTKRFIQENNIELESKLLRDLMDDPDAEWNFHFLPWSDTYVIKTRMFETELWKKWLAAVDQNGGIYKYRWGDNELISLFHMMFCGVPIDNLRLVENGYHDQGMFRNMQNIAPGVKNS